MIDKAGEYKDLPFKEYQEIDAVNNSKLTTYYKSPQMCNVIDDPSAAMKLGSAIHSFFLEPENFEKDYAVMPQGMTRRGKKYTDFLANNLGKEEISSKDFDIIDGLKENLNSGNYETAKSLIDKGEKEVSLVWRNRTYGCLCKGRLDLKIPELGIIADIKSSKEVNPVDWFNKKLKSQYQPHYQPAWYLDGINTVQSEVKYNTFLWILMETERPYRISVVKATPAEFGEPDMVLTAQEELKKILGNYLDSKVSGNWPGMPDKVVSVNLPKWYLNKL